FEAAWSGAAEDDGFNRLVFRAGLSWREVVVLRAVFAYLRQGGTTFSPSYAQRTLLSHHRVTTLLIELFHARFDPAVADRPESDRGILARLDSRLAEIENLNEDRLLRAFMSVLTRTVRTNFYQRNLQGEDPAYLV